MSESSQDYSIKKNGEGCIQHKYTIKEIKEIKALITNLLDDTTTNKANLITLTVSFKELATANSLTHYKLFARTEKLKIGQARTETLHQEHIKSDDKSDSNKKHKTNTLISWCAIGISILTVILLAKQAGIFGM